MILTASQAEALIDRAVEKAMNARCWFGDAEIAEWQGLSVRAWKAIYQADPALQATGQLREFEGGAQRWFWRRDLVGAYMDRLSAQRTAL